MSDKPFNPFEHHHEHHHDDVEFDPSELDPAQQSLNDALRVSFMLLKIVMILIMIFYVFSGVFTVSDQELAVRLKFGEIVTVDEVSNQKLLTKGVHWAWPFPIEEVVKIPMTTHTIELNESFWFEIDRAAEGQTLDSMRGRALNPEKDGSLLTGDANIVHVRWAVTFKVDETNATDYVQNVGDMDRAKRLVELAAEQGSVFAASRVTAGDFIRSTSQQGIVAKSRAQQVLDNMNAGLSITQFDVTGEPTVPISVRPSYRAATDAISQRDQEVQKALQQRDEILVEAAGEAWEPIYAMVQEYELARLAGDQQQTDAAWQRVEQAFQSGRTSVESGEKPIGGEAAKRINEARTYRTRVVEKIKSEANEFQQLLERYRESPQVFMSRAKAEVWKQVLDNNVEIMYLPEGDQYRIKINRNPDLRKKREAERAKKLQEEQAAAAGR